MIDGMSDRLGDVCTGRCEYNEALSLYISAVKRLEDSAPLKDVNRLQVREREIVFVIKD
jgi:hypothetical protein